MESVASVDANPRELGEDRTRWLMLGLVWLLYLSFGLTVGSMAPLLTLIIDDLDMTYGQMGFVLGFWQLVYIGTATPLGSLIDRLGVKKSLGIGIVVIWASLVFRGLAVDFPTLLVAVGLFGIGGPIISAGAPKVVATWFSGRERGLAAGIYTTGPITGISLALIIGGNAIIPMLGTWRGISLVYGVVIAVIALAWWLLSRDAPVSATEASVERGSMRSEVMALLKMRNVQVVLLLAIAVFLLNHGLTNWLPTLLLEGGMSLSASGTVAAAATAVGVVGLLTISGYVRYGRRAMVLGALIALGAASTFGMVFFTGPALIGTLLVSGVVRGPMMPVLTLVLMETRGIGAARMGIAGGLFFAAAEIGGFGGPFILGFLRDVTGSLDSGILVLAIVMGVLFVTVPLIKEPRGEAEAS